MALPDYITHTKGTQVVWGNASGTSPTVTNTLSLNNLANNAARMGVFTDLQISASNTTLYEEYDLEFIWESGTAPTAGLTVELYISESSSSSLFPGTVDGTDAAYTVANRFQVGPPRMVLYALNSTNTSQRQGPVIYRPAGRYIAPVVVNLSGQTSRNNATAANSTCRVILTPRQPTIQDAS